MASNSIDALRQTRPEWMPWLAVVGEALQGAGAECWESAVPTTRPANDLTQPLLAGATIAADARAVRGLFERLVRLASRCGTPQMAGLDSALRGHVDHGRLLRASIAQDSGAIAAVAHDTGVDAGALHAVVALLCVPVVQACRQRWAASIPPAWSKGHCPVCAAWPAFAEIRGIDRHRYLRCGRCGAEWLGEVLRCSFCRNLDHEQMATLVPDRQGTRGVIEACRRCHGYVKAFTTLQGAAPLTVMLEDLASVELDIAALEQGYARPEGAATAFDVEVEVQASSSRFFVWSS